MLVAVKPRDPLTFVFVAILFLLIAFVACLPPRAGVAGYLTGTGGLRKLRFADERRGKGKRGGLRVIYYWWDAGSQFWLFTIYDKDETSDLDEGSTRNAEANDQEGTRSKEEAMKRSVKATRKRGVKRDLFAELTEGMDALADARHGKRTLRTHAVEFKPAPSLTPKELVRVRKNLKLSRALFAVYLRTNVRTLENWEQGRAKPNAQAALLINLVKHYPDTVERLASI